VDFGNTEWVLLDPFGFVNVEVFGLIAQDFSVRLNGRYLLSKVFIFIFSSSCVSYVCV
jgi:hypothetical protein